MGRDIAGFSLRDPDPNALEAEVDRTEAAFRKPTAPVHPLRTTLQNAMWDDVGVMRTAAGLANGLSRVATIRTDLTEIGVDPTTRAFNLTWHDWLNMASLVEVSQVITQAALARENSRGAHFREDYPEQGDLDASYYTVARMRGPEIDVTRAAVQFTIVRPGETILPEGEPESLVAAG